MTDAARTGVSAALASAAWRALLSEVFAGEAFARLEAFLEEERAAGVAVLPAPEDVFTALDLVEPEDVRVVILGQDPYPTPGHAHGLAFSYRGDGSLPRSLRNILREIEEDTGVAPAPGRGDLTPWARQGVLLLNAVLTVRAAEAGAHAGKGWEGLTDAVLAALAARDERIVFVLWGRVARAKRALVGDRHPVLEAGHPSPLSIRHFRGCRHFSRVNALTRGPAIDWSLRGRERKRG